MTSLVSKLTLEHQIGDVGVNWSKGVIPSTKFPLVGDQKQWNGDSYDVTEVLPKNDDFLEQFVPLEAQAGGHKFEEKGTNKGAFIGCLQSKKLGTVLKRLQDAARGRRELAFYEKVFASEKGEEGGDQDRAAILGLRDFVPAYHGKLQLDGFSYLMLEDLTRGFVRPCVIDVKMGTQTFDPWADDLKKQREVKKYCNIKDIGFCVTAYRIYDSVQDRFRIIEDCEGKDFWRQLTHSQMRLEFSRLLPSDPLHRRLIVTGCLRRLQQLQQWFSRQQAFAFYSSSVLIVYEGEPYLDAPSVQERTNVFSPLPTQYSFIGAQDCEGLCNGDVAQRPDVTRHDSEDSASSDSLEENSISSPEIVSEASSTDLFVSPHVGLHMIDFAHAYGLKEIGLERDEGYDHGLDNLIGLFKSFESLM